MGIIGPYPCEWHFLPLNPACTTTTTSTTAIPITTTTTTTIAPTTTTTSTQAPTTTTTTTTETQCIIFDGYDCTIQFAHNVGDAKPIGLNIIGNTTITLPSLEAYFGSSYINGYGVRFISSYTVSQLWEYVNDYLIIFTIGGIQYGPYRYEYSGSNSSGGFDTPPHGQFNVNSSLLATYYVQISYFDADGNNLTSLLQTFGMGDGIYIYNSNCSPTTTTTTTICTRPQGLTDGKLIAECFNSGDPWWSFSSVSVEEACDAWNYFYPGINGGLGLWDIQYDTLQVGELLYLYHYSTACIYPPDGYYWWQPDDTNSIVYFRNPGLTEITIATVVNGYVTDINTCQYNPTTTTTTTTIQE